jgi:hypothetical protein
LETVNSVIITANNQRFNKYIMVNNLDNVTPPVPETTEVNPPIPAVQRKWYQHKSVIAIIVFAVFAAGACLAYYNFIQRKNTLQTTTNNKSASTYSKNTSATSTSTPVDAVSANSLQTPPAYLHINNNSLELIQADKTTSLKTYPKDEKLFLSQISPDKNFVILQHYNDDKDGYISNFGSARTGLALINLHSPYKVQELIKSGSESQSYINWSPDSSYISYVTNDGESVKILSLSDNKVVFSATSHNSMGGVRPLVWLDSSYFSYIVDGNAYTGTLSNPKEKLLTTDADNSTCQFEGPPTLLPLDWSPNKKYVAYIAKSSLVVLDTDSGKKYNFGSKNSDEGYCAGPIIPTGLGWIGNEYFLTDDNSTIKYITLPTGSIKSYTFFANKGEEISGIPLVAADGQYIGLLGNRLAKPTENGNPWTSMLYSLSKPGQRCQIETYFYPFTDTREHTWEQNGYALISFKTDYTSNQFDVKVIDINTCQLLGSVKGIWPEYDTVLDTQKLPSIMDLVNIVKK